MCAEEATSDMDKTNNDNIDSASSSGSASASSLSSIEIITKLGTNLVRQLLADVDTLFISQPFTISR